MPLAAIILIPMERHLLSYCRIPLAGNVTGSDEVKKKVFIVGVRTDTAEEQFKKQLDGKQGLAAVRQAAPPLRARKLKSCSARHFRYRQVRSH
jgi:hypothetical protein